jgi:hypothetical protein
MIALGQKQPSINVRNALLADIGWGLFFSPPEQAAI